MRPPFYSANDNQNYFVNEGRTSSRVLQAPGGRSSINLSWNTSKNEKLGELSKLLFEKIRVICFRLSLSKIPSNSKDNRTNVSNNSFANGSSMNCGNVLTDRPSSRVLRPPGGSSSINLS